MFWQSKVTIPPLFTRSWTQNKDRERIKDFFTKEGGSIVVTEAVCLTHKVDISDISKKTFVQPFVDAILALANAEPDKREFEYKGNHKTPSSSTHHTCNL